jgi:hypothetical protein
MTTRERQTVAPATPTAASRLPPRPGFGSVESIMWLSKIDLRAGDHPGPHARDGPRPTARRARSRECPVCLTCGNASFAVLGQVLHEPVGRLGLPANSRDSERMSDARYATIATFGRDLTREAVSREGLHGFIVPGVRRHGGVVSGHWMMDREAQESVAVVTFTSRDAAEAFRRDVTNNAENQAAAGVELRQIRLVEVEASFLSP